MNRRLKLFEMFAGYGGASFGLKKAKIPYECVGFSEIDKWAIKVYQMNHCTFDRKKGERLNIYPKNYGDSSKINPNELPDFDLLTAGFPCQSFSVAGKGLGELDTRGTLFNDIIRIAEVKKPQYILLENVKGLISKKHKETFNKILSELKRIGYNVDWFVLNSKDYGVPQNRERVWIICNLNKINVVLPKKEELKIKLKDILDDGFVDRDTSYCIDANYFKGTNVEQYLKKHRRQIVFSCPIKRLGRNQKNYPSDYSMCVDTLNTNGVYKNGIFRKLTPKECFRLMGFIDEEIILEGLTDTQMYKLAGNGWDINIVSKILSSWLKNKKKRKRIILNCDSNIQGELNND